jgi:hypothetical protein
MRHIRRYAFEVHPVAALARAGGSCVEKDLFSRPGNQWGRRRHVVGRCWREARAGDWDAGRTQALPASHTGRCASHSRSLDQRRRPPWFLTAMAKARRCPTSTTTRLPRVTPV